MDDMVPDDIYALDRDATPDRLALQACDNGSFRLHSSTDLGRPGATVHLDCAIVLMSPLGENTDALVLVEVDNAHRVEAVYLMPLSPLRARIGYTLVNLDRDNAAQKYAETGCVSFMRGTHITMASGMQVPIEDIKAGDRVLTRDAGVQEVRWIGTSTLRASGDLAPVRIRAGTLNNSGDLIVSPNHRLFVYQRRDRIGAGQPELMVKAAHLVNGDSVTVMSGGFAEYFQILFDRHHIIYAEGIAAESMLVEPRNRPALPPDLLAKLTEVLPGHDGPHRHGLDVQQALLTRPDAIDILRRASLG
jgi:hypothetical protein